MTIDELERLSKTLQLLKHDCVTYVDRRAIEIFPKLVAIAKAAEILIQRENFSICQACDNDRCYCNTLLLTGGICDWCELSLSVCGLY